MYAHALNLLHAVFPFSSTILHSHEVVVFNNASLVIIPPFVLNTNRLTTVNIYKILLGDYLALCSNYGALNANDFFIISLYTTFN